MRTDDGMEETEGQLGERQKEEYRGAIRKLESQTSALERDCKWLMMLIFWMLMAAILERSSTGLFGFGAIVCAYGVDQYQRETELWEIKMSHAKSEEERERLGKYERSRKRFWLVLILVMIAICLTVIALQQHGVLD